ncbi:AAA+-type ATPase, partial [Pseudocyphellaria aurata]|nr:AAA+-type ATPase [Pseudocyphellaria aurata]
MASLQTYAVRPFLRPAQSDFKDVLRVYLSPSALLLHEFRAGDSCQLRNSGGVIGPAMVWPAPEKIQDTVVQLSKTLQILYGLKLGDKISVVRTNLSIETARSIILVEVPRVVSKISLSSLTEADQLHWAWVLQHTLGKAEIVSPGVMLDGVEAREERRSFKVLEVNSSGGCALYRIQPQTSIKIKIDIGVNDSSRGSPKTTFKINTDGIGGLDRQLKELNDRLATYSEEQRSIRYPSYYRPRRGGTLLHGPSGTGKSLIIARLSEGGWRKILHIHTSVYGDRGIDRKARVHELFDEAHLHQPSLIIIDGIDSIAGKEESHRHNSYIGVASSLCEEFDRLGAARIFIIAATTSLSNVDKNLRRPGRFEFEIEIPVPDSKARAEILKIITGQPKNAFVEALENLADRTHGFVGADLDRLVQLAVEHAGKRIEACQINNHPNGADNANQGEAEIVVEVTLPDLEKALLEVRPTAMREVFLETPKVRWTDIGGQHEVKKALEQAVEWPFKYPTEMDRLGIEYKKGLLLYGPPGCSKTLIAKAVATETGLNFIAVKGAELLSMYVGESERAVRDVFRKARAASPSVVFFDEIDAIGSLREGSTMAGGLNVLTTLLNELDGIEVLKGVFVLAATNKPEILDPALMRPGRLDTALHVGLPDFEARREILRIRLRLMDVDDEVDDTALARSTAGYSGAELVSICQKAGYAALEEQVRSKQQQRIGTIHFDSALAQVYPQVTTEMAR